MAQDNADHPPDLKRPLLGAHMSIAGGVSQALERGRAAGCRMGQRESGIELVVAHDSYLVNLGATDAALRKKSIAGVIDELERCEQLGVPFLIAHPGAHVGAGEEAGIRNIAQAIDEAHTACPGYRVKIALEITAGQGSNLGYKLEQMGQIIDSVKDNGRLRLCFDTEHAFAAGYDLRSDEGYERTFAELDKYIGLEMLAAFHINDSMKPLNSRVS